MNKPFSVKWSWPERAAFCGKWVWLGLVPLFWVVLGMVSGSVLAAPGPVNATLLAVPAGGARPSEANPGQQRWLVGLRLVFPEGWHGYWRNGGDSGEPPSYELTSDQANVESAPIQWPVPRVTTEGAPPETLTVHVLEGDVLLMRAVNVALKRGQKGPVTLATTAHWLACKDICKPQSAHLTMTLPQDVAAVGAAKAVFEDARAKLPQQFHGHATLQPAKGGAVLRLTGLSPQVLRNVPLAEVRFLPDEAGLVEASSAQDAHWHGQALELHLKAQPSWQTPGPTSAGVKGTGENALGIESLSGLLLVGGHGYSVVARPGAGLGTGLATSQATQPPLGSVAHYSAVRKGRQSWGLLLAAAFLGGVVLNFMPCVFPVLALKAMALLRQQTSAGLEHRARRWNSQREGLAYAAGVVGAVTALGLVITLGRALGRHWGWGVQFQSPFFVLALGWLFLLMALDLAGFWQVGPGFHFKGQPAAPPGGTGFWGSVAAWGRDMLGGVVTVAAATPCTAPFLGIALGAALALGGLGGVLLFAVMGVGLAFPFLLLAFCPVLTRFMPRPGSWMNVLRTCLCWPLLGSCVWLLWVGTCQVGAGFVLVGAGGAVAMALGAWLWDLGRWQAMAGPGHGLGRAKVLRCAALTLWVGCLVVGWRQTSVGTTVTPAQGGKGVERMAFTPQTLEQLRQQGRPVLLDVGAAWCVTCLLNEHLVLDSAAVQEALVQHHAVLMHADWTRHDPVLTAWLEGQHHLAVPYDVWFPTPSPQHLKGAEVVLPALLTVPHMLRALSSP
ncbi:protein-disulfide reductase DsbD family protein [Formicincola oecophyllae]|nr:thioredoxin family protein [Formicincola oecophyllae]